FVRSPFNVGSVSSSVLFVLACTTHIAAVVYSREKGAGWRACWCHPGGGGGACDAAGLAGASVRESLATAVAGGQTGENQQPVCVHPSDPVALGYSSGRYPHR